MTDHSSSSSPSLSHSSNSSPSSTFSLSSLENTALVPFLWGKNGGISKEYQEITKTIQPLPLNIDFIGRRRILKVPSSNKGDSIYSHKRPLPPPPCLQQPSQHAAPCRQRRNVLSNSKNQIRTFSETFIGRRQRNLRAKDDPFLLAIEVCRKKGNDTSDHSNLTSKVVAKLRRKKEGYNMKESIQKTASTYSFKSLSFERKERNASIERHKYSKVSGINGDSKHFSDRSSQIESSLHASSKTRSLKSSQRGTDKSRDFYKNSSSQARKEGQVPAKFRSESRRKQCHRVQVSCAQHRKLNFHASKENKQTIQAWFGCRSAGSFNSVINPSTKNLPIIS